MPSEPVASHAGIEPQTAQPSLRTALMVLGMHRSGTSAMTRVLGLCGAGLPQQSAMDTHESNPLGHWEPWSIVDTHDAFLSAAGTRWDAVADYPAAIFESPAAEACRRRLVQLVHQEYGGMPTLLVLKDPRISRLMPLWRPVLESLGATPRVIIMVRNPIEVAASLKRRDGWGEQRGLAVWLRYLLCTERATRDLPRCFVDYDQLVGDWRSVIAKISEQLNIAFSEFDPETERDIDAFVRQDLRHHRSARASLLARDDIAECVKQAYRCFSAAAETGAVDLAALDFAATTFDRQGPLNRMRRETLLRGIGNAIRSFRKR